MIRIYSTSLTNIVPTTASGENTYTTPVYTQYTTTNSNGQIYTVTNLVSGSSPTGAAQGSSNGHSTSGFFANKGAVAATFIVVGLAGTALVLVGVLALIRRHRAKQFERDVAMTAAHAARTTRKPPSEYDDYEDDMARYPAVTAPEMTQRNVGPAAGYGGGGGYGQAAAGVAGFGAAAALAGAPAPPPVMRETSPPPNDYYNTMPYGSGGGNASSYPPQPQPAFSSSHGHDAYDEYAAAYGPSGGYGDASYNHQPAPTQQYGQAYDAYPAYGGHDAGAYGAYDNNAKQHQAFSPPSASGMPPTKGGRVPIADTSQYITSPTGGRSPENGSTGAYGRNLTPAAPAAGGGRGGSGGSRKSLLDDSRSEKSYYSEEEEPNLQPKRSLRIANE